MSLPSGCSHPTCSNPDVECQHGDTGGAYMQHGGQRADELIAGSSTKEGFGPLHETNHVVVRPNLHPGACPWEGARLLQSDVPVLG
jgi:hypothetical protein